MNIGRLSGIVIMVGVVLWAVSPAVPPATPAAGAYADQATITIVGRAGSFGPLREAVPSGQRLGQLEVPGWAFPAARKPSNAVIATDGSLLMPAISHNDSLTVPTSPEMAVAAYDPRTNTSEIVRLATTPAAVGPKRMMIAPTVTGLVPLPGGAVAFIGWTEGLESAAPAFGLLTKVDGQWRSLPANRWTAHALGLTRPRGLARLPGSGDLIVAQDGGAITALRVTGPDLSGRYAVIKRGAFAHPADVTMREVHADPTGRLGAEGFVVGMDRPGSPPVVQEFRYDERTGKLTARSAPLLPGDESPLSKKLYGYPMGLYDRMGNLWAARQESFLSGRLAVYTRERCPPDASPWARACRPDYDIIQASELRAPRGLIEDPVSGTMVLIVEGGMLMPVRAKASGGGLAFEIGNLVDIGGKVMTIGEGSSVDSRPGAVDRSGRLWFPTSRATHDAGGTTSIDHWLFTVKLGELFTPPPVRLPDVPGRRVTIQTENTVTISTRQAAGKTAAREVDSDAYFSECTDTPSISCGNDGTPGNGFYLRDSTGYGHLQGSLAYRVDVPVAGNYRLSYQVSTFEATKEAEIEMTIADRKHVTAVSTNGDWRPMRTGEIVWFHAGVQTITIAPTKGGGGWFLNSMTLQRV